MEAKNASVEKTRNQIKSERLASKIPDHIKTFAASTTVTAGAIGAVTVLATTLAINTLLITGGTVLAFLSSVGSYFLAEKVILKRIKEFKKKTAIAAAIATTITMTPPAVAAFNSQEFRDKLEPTLIEMTDDLKEQWKKNAEKQKDWGFKMPGETSQLETNHPIETLSV